MKINMLNVIRGITSTLEKTSPTLAQKWAKKLFFSPRNSKQEIPDIPGLQQHWHTYTRTDGTKSKCRIYTAGNGPAVILVHGWESSASRMSAIANQLLEKGLRVILFDLPAHGFSPGKNTNLVDVSTVIQDLAKNIAANENEFLAIVSHSFGAACSGHAIKSGINPDHFISIGAPSSMDFILNSFCAAIGASEQTKKGLINHIEEILKGPYEKESLTSMAKQLNPKGLIIHDLDDRMVPYTHAEAFSAAWQEAKLFTTEKLGHNRILKNQEVIQTIAASLVPE